MPKYLGRVHSTDLSHLNIRFNRSVGDAENPEYVTVMICRYTLQDSQGEGLVERTRKVELARGPNKITFTDIAAQLVASINTDRDAADSEYAGITK
jgi:hypothetical protein